MSRIIQLMPKSLQDRLDVKRCSDMALVHDMAEALVGDITPVDGVAKEEKSRRESETMDYICNNLLGQYEDGSQGRELRELWQEYEDSKTPESKFVHDVDKVELILQMYEYEERYKCEKDLGEFAWVTTKIETPEAKRMSDRILLDRVALWKKYGKEAKWPQDTKPETKMVP
ncbi:hypothetical protein BU23DRAFT_548394 [Bimuria novae-zelandiae CBS 107.79]|uniref:HD domain-containing protein n=1 Tax=Bimuria novae-zelandiae CBS 107.79 TaxID=1447943 RepID=A0A6A5VTY7_9PLEO|nr:hypothetical protein BU23DRAFT_548394 [Bimuria novae-zelandiae CBS 107.79]